MQHFISYDPDSKRDIRKVIKHLRGLIGDIDPPAPRGPAPRTPHEPLFQEVPEGQNVEEQLRVALLVHLGELSNPGTNQARYENISLREVGELSGTCGASLQRFVNRERSLRLDRAARVACYLKLQLRGVE